jgi:peptidoglycan-N-acetylglucosamine deacetylase
MLNKNLRKVIAAVVMSVIFVVAPICIADASSTKLKCVKTAPGGYVCLTIDDGYGRDKIKADLDILRANNVHCTFFVIGTQLTKYPDLWQQAIRDGNEICYHTMKHQSLSSWSNKKIIADLRAWIKIAKKVLGANYAIPHFVRLPGGSGSSNQRILKLFQSYGYHVVYWSSDTLTGAVNRHKAIDKYIKSSTKSGSIILTHFNCYDAPALPKYIGWLKAHFKLATLTQAFAPPQAPTPAPTDSPTPAPTDSLTPTPTESSSPEPSDSPTVDPGATTSPDSETTPEPSGPPEDTTTAPVDPSPGQSG